MSTARERGRLASTADRLGCTEGQVWSMTIGLLVAVLVTCLALPGVDWVDGGRAAASTAPPHGGSPGAGEGLGDPDVVGGFVQPDVVQRIADLLNPPAPPPSPSPTSDPPAEPGARACDAQLLIDAADQLLTPLDAALGGLLPSVGVIGLLANTAGCTEGDATFALVGLVLDAARGLPPVPVPDLDLLPALPLPPELDPVIVALGPVAGPACGAVGAVVTILQLIAPELPWPIGGEDFASLLLEAAILCARFQAAAP